MPPISLPATQPDSALEVLPTPVGSLHPKHSVYGISVDFPFSLMAVPSVSTHEDHRSFAFVAVQGARVLQENAVGKRI